MFSSGRGQRGSAVGVGGKVGVGSGGAVGGNVAGMVGKRVGVATGRVAVMVRVGSTAGVGVGVVWQAVTQKSNRER